MSPLKFIRKKIEIVLTRAACWLIAPLPRRAVLALAHFLGTLGYHFSGRLKAVGRANIDLVFGDTMSPQEKVRILKASCCTFALVMLDLAWLSRKTAERVNASNLPGTGGGRSIRTRSRRTPRRSRTTRSPTRSVASRVLHSCSWSEGGL